MFAAEENTFCAGVVSIGRRLSHLASLKDIKNTDAIVTANTGRQISAHLPIFKNLLLAAYSENIKNGKKTINDGTVS